VRRVITGTQSRTTARRYPIARRHGIAVDFVDGIGESIPFPDNSFDSIHVGLVLCSVDDVAATLGEIRRVLAPGGRFEHVGGDGAMSRFQDLIAEAVVLVGFWLQAEIAEPSTRLPRPNSIPGAAPTVSASPASVVSSADVSSSAVSVPRTWSFGHRWMNDLSRKAHVCLMAAAEGRVVIQSTESG
jgi:SAM-dependent methyltransferase